MFFGGGLIPFYKVVSDLGMLDSPLSIILPGTVSAWNLFMAKTFFQTGVPGQHHRGGGTRRREQGCASSSPSSCPSPCPSWRCSRSTTRWGSGTATSHAMIFLQDANLFPLQLVLKEILTASESTTGGSGETILEQFPPCQPAQVRHGSSSRAFPCSASIPSCRSSSHRASWSARSRTKKIF